MHKVQTIATGESVVWCVCPFIYHSHALIPRKTAERIELPFGVKTPGTEGKMRFLIPLQKGEEEMGGHVAYCTVYNSFDRWRDIQRSTE